MMVVVSPQEPSLYTVKAVIILDNDGDRLFAKVRGTRGDSDTQGAGMGTGMRTPPQEDVGTGGAQVLGRSVASGGLGRDTGQGHGDHGEHVGVACGTDKGKFGGTGQGQGRGDRVEWPGTG